PDDPEPRLAMLAAWAWFSTEIGTDARQLISTRWRPDLAFETAIVGAKSWFNRLRLAALYLNRQVADPWLAGGVVRGYHVVPLLTAKDLLAESRGMHNCVDQFAKRISEDRCRLFSIRTSEGVRLATVEIGQHPRETGFLAINQIKGRHNLPASVEAWQVAHTWMGEQKNLCRMPPIVLDCPHVDRGAWLGLMKPYIDAKGDGRAVPRNVSVPILNQLDEDLANLARRGGVTSWLFNT
ncbi:MAG TPA: PcfJ domain-containing protein, partial [Hyphomicrobiaceae bacterium]|nr:PcfJ domain-containing protein [Hyphomicrobiaceae bacterium]